MARFLSQEWVDEFNTALDDVVLPLPGPDAGLAAEDGCFVVVQEVRGAPGGDVRVTLRVDGGRVQLRRSPLDDGDIPAADHGDVTIALSYGDAAALSAGELPAADALTSGRVRVRGDLSVLVSAQSMLETAREQTAALAAVTTY